MPIVRVPGPDVLPYLPLSLRWRHDNMELSNFLVNSWRGLRPESIGFISDSLKPLQWRSLRSNQLKAAEATIRGARSSREFNPHQHLTPRSTANNQIPFRSFLRSPSSTTILHQPLSIFLHNAAHQALPHFRPHNSRQRLRQWLRRSRPVRTRSLLRRRRLPPLCARSGP